MPYFKNTQQKSILLFCYSVTKLGLTLCDPHGLQNTRFPFPPLSPKFAQTHVHRVGDAIQPSHPLSAPSPVLNLSTSGSFPVSQFFTSGDQSIGASSSVSGLPMNIKDWFLLGLTSFIFLQSKGHWRVFSSTTIQKHQLFNTQLSLWSNSHIFTWLLEKPQLWPNGCLLAKWCLWYSVHSLGLS